MKGLTPVESDICCRSLDASGGVFCFLRPAIISNTPLDSSEACFQRSVGERESKHIAEGLGSACHADAGPKFLGLHVRKQGKSAKVATIAI